MPQAVVSVIIPFYNAERFLGEAVESVLAQTRKDWELLLVDDGSTDGGAAIARRYAHACPSRIRYLSYSGQKNLGVCHARNLGIRNSTAAYVAFLDADDVWLAHKLDRQLSLMSAHPQAGAVFGHSEYWFDWRGSPDDIGKNLVPPLVASDRLYVPPTLLTLCHPIGRMGVPCPSDILVRREVLEHIGGFEEAFDHEFQPFEDQAFLTKLYLNANVFVSSECWDKYRRREDSCWTLAQGTGSIEASRRFYFDWLYQYLRRSVVTDPTIWRAVERATWRYRHPQLAACLVSARRIGGRAKRALSNRASRAANRR